MPIRNRIGELHSEITGWRQHLHAHPELMFDVQETAGFVVDQLKAAGVTDITEGIGQTGVVAVIEGKTNTSGRVIGLRADMDALPIEEITGLDYASNTPGKMHACGHDGHTAMLLGAAKYLAETRNFDGKVVLIFQPAEEGGGGGKEMCDDGMMDRWGVQEVYGMHNAPGIPVGQFATRPGALMASADQFQLTIQGKGGHAAEPHKAIDTNVVAAHTLIALQSIAARNADPLQQLVVSVCGMQSDNDSFNVIPNTVTLRGTVRTLDKGVRDLAQERVTAIAQNTAAAFGATVEVDYNRGYPITINHAEQAAMACDAAAAVVGEDNVERNVPPIMPAEDFSYMLEERPGAYMFIGNGDSAQCHHPAYNFDDEAIPVGVSWFAEIVERRMPAN
ncbi:MAG: M20 aminoacylase family protein [Paracoccaceae bacterium]